MNKQQTSIGIACAIASAACFGTIPYFSKIVYTNGVTPVTLLFFRFAIASLCLGTLAIAQREGFPSGKNLAKLVDCQL